MKQIVIFLLILSLSNCMDICDENSDQNITFYKNYQVQNCGCENCVRKCCKSGFFLDRDSICRQGKYDNFTVPQFIGKSFLRNLNKSDKFLTGILNCSFVYLLTDSWVDEYFLQENGEMWMSRWGSDQGCEPLLSNTEYCVDERDGLKVVVCGQESKRNIVSKDLKALGMIISMPFLLVTFLVYAILPDRNLHQMALMFYVLSLLLSYLLLVTINLKSGLAPPLCEILGYSTLYCFMVSFFWMNVICFDIWFTFSGCRGFVGSKRSSERKKLALYSLYAFGVPLLVVVIVLVLDTFLPDCSIYKPGIGNEKCFLADGWPNLWYFYGEAGILVITNIVFFALTAWKIRQVKKETEMLKHNDSKRHNYEKDKQKFNLYVKLLFAMGANWSMEVISWLVNWQTDGSYSAIWYVPDFFNAIYGVFIFFIFVFKKKIWLLLKRRYYNFVGKPHLANTLTSANTRTSHYSSTNYSTADTNISSASTGRARQEEVALRGMST